ncbi:unnamed protein product [Acanthosepion pharaonis]|uniref:Uncharacterized protein n=1 Tax=Acanthosepion pharaonis TaxID=158019 RepID=A0A812C1P3_ACAPH|nr:unnamed protein product [Sepia pharaonis]
MTVPRIWCLSRPFGVPACLPASSIRRASLPACPVHSACLFTCLSRPFGVLPCLPVPSIRRASLPACLVHSACLFTCLSRPFGVPLYLPVPSIRRASLPACLVHSACLYACLSRPFGVPLCLPVPSIRRASLPVSASCLPEPASWCFSLSLSHPVGVSLSVACSSFVSPWTRQVCCLSPGLSLSIRLLICFTFSASLI